MNERIRELAEQAGFDDIDEHGVYVVDSFIDSRLERFAELIRQDEREACAKVCDDLDDVIMYELAGWQYGDAIRGRTKPKSDFKNQMDDNWSGII